MRLMNWNIEWMNKWFAAGGTATWRTTHTGIASVSALAQRVADVITSIDPDLLTLQEGPSGTEGMGLFIRDFLSDGQGVPPYDALGGLSGGAQKIYTLAKRGGQFSNEAVGMSLHREISFEVEICRHLAASGWLHVDGDAATYDRARALFPDDVLAWVQAAQPDAWQTLTKNHGAAASASAAAALPGRREDPDSAERLRRVVERLQGHRDERYRAAG